LVGLFNHPVKLKDGRTLTADDAYLRNAIVNSNSMPLPNYAPVMPSFQGQINEEQLLQLIAYIKSLGPEERKSAGK
jgi:cytochrome c oxidase subunit 2